MATTKQVIGLLLAAGAAVAVYKISQMTREERNEWLNKLKEDTLYVLDKAEVSMEKVNQYFDQVKEKDADQWVDKLLVIKNMVNEFYGSGKSTSKQTNPEYT